MSGKTQLANEVFSYLGHEHVTNIDDSQEDQAVAFNGVYDSARREILSAGTAWRFATKVKKLNKKNEESEHPNYTAIYQLPTNPQCLYIVRVVNMHLDSAYEVIGDCVYSSEQPVLEYVSDVSIDKFPPMLFTALAYSIASKLAIALNGKKTTSTEFYQKAEMAIDKAAFIDEQGRRNNQAQPNLSQSRGFNSGRSTGFY